MKKSVFLIMAAWMASGLAYGQDGLVETGDLESSASVLPVVCYDLDHIIPTVNGTVQENVMITVTPDPNGDIFVEDIKNGIVTYLNALLTKSIDSSSIILTKGNQPLSPVSFGKVPKAIVADGVNFSLSSSGSSST